MRVLYVEDNMGDQLAFKQAFHNDINIHFDIAASINEARKKLNHTAFDVIVSDFNLPDGNSFDVINLKKGVPVIVITGAGSEEIAVKLMKAGAKDYLIKDFNGNYLKILPVVLEKTIKHLQAEKAQSTLAAIVESAGDAIFTIDDKATILTCNKGAVEMYGYDTTEINGMEFISLCNEGHKLKFNTILNSVKVNEMTAFDEMVHSKKDKKDIYVYLSISPVFDDNKETTCFSVITRDITDLKKKEEDLHKANFQLERSKYLDAKKDEFIGIASHELKTPLTSIKAYMQVLERQMESPVQPDHNQLLASFKKTNVFIKRLELLINDLLDVSKIQAGRLQYNMSLIDLNELIMNCVELSRGLSDKHIISIKGYADKKVEADKYRLEEVLTNFLSNAFKYSPDQPDILVEYYTNEKEAVVSVKDHGVGISADHTKNVFKRYFRVEDKSYNFTGLGVGLYICKEIIARHHGEVWLESVAGQGSTFYFSIPLVQPKTL